MSETLCCCEYVNKDGERSHLLTCCCNCVDLDYAFDRLITCKKIPRRVLLRIMATASDRMRLPWKNGAVKVSCDTLMPLFLLPAAIAAAAQGVWLSVIVFSFMPIVLMYIHFFYMKCRTVTYFFFVWGLMSLIIIIVMFESIGMFLLGFTPFENAIFMLLVTAVLYCMFKVKSKAVLCEVTTSAEVGYEDSKSSSLCSICNMKVPDRAFHCYICDCCIMLRDQHCAWLNCCIGRYNHRWYMILLLCSISFFIYCSNLILTTACHPLKVWNMSIGVVIMLPDDCSDVYYDFFYALGFVTSLYSLEAVVFLASLIFHEIILISMGMTGHEWRSSGRIRCTTRGAHSHGFIRNWLYYLRGIDTSSSSSHNI